MNHPIIEHGRLFHRVIGLLILVAWLSTGSCSSLRNLDGDFSDRVLKGEKIEEGVASWYGPDFHRKPTANTEIYDMNALTAAHPTLPFNTEVLVRSQENGKSVRVRINDRGPYVGGRVIDLSRRAAEELDMIRNGTMRVEIVLIGEGDTPVYREHLGKEVFTIQLGSFSQLSKARELTRRVDGSVIVQREVRGQVFYRVYNGRYATREEAERAMRRLRSRKGLDGIVIQYQN